MQIYRQPKINFAQKAVKVTLIILLALVGAAVVAMLIRSSILPALYVGAVAALWLAGLGVVCWLLFRDFIRLRLAARISGVMLAVVMVGIAGFGVVVLHNALGVLDDISKGGTVSIKSNEPFYVFISGIDTYGDIGVQSRSDVNILAGVNPNTNTVTLVTVPRDSYLPIALGGNDQYDKLTHAGNYGVESSMETVANLFGVKVDAYVRVNFTSFISGVDKLGGITVSNPVAFSSSGVEFPVGDIELNGEQALIYSRERMSLAGGDLDRGKNQQRVISAIITKASSIRSLGGFQGLLEIGQDSVQTNVSGEAIRELISRQVDKPTQWQTKTLELTGHGETGTRPSYAISGAELYMYILDEGSVGEVKRQLNTEMSAR